ncbi:MAG: hypothetical protein AVDCRST_MAG19-1235 [uncultured Thermomicrobiales bacterium]|uniref:N-acetyltransferase domain-containing protein n=1 Tax=uncultured Thermomicrobiales bacterium TaxID=1645740 RepID=A0A6J4UTX6_9BACT|nr:MAG: hypothetical protein AVDCRST_MAG19-1235 [uncultured Thermomicrobiales bacterium]
MPVVAETDRVVVRTFRSEDAADAHAWYADPEVARYTLWEPHTREETEARVRRLAAIVPPGVVGEWAEYAVELTEEGRVVGSVSLKIDDDVSRQAELGWFFAPRYQGRGLATEATAALMRYGVGLGVHRFYAVADPRNIASTRLMERLGMRREGYFRERMFYKGEWSDDVVYGVLARELGGAAGGEGAPAVLPVADAGGDG